MRAIGKGLDKRLDKLEDELASLREQRRETAAKLEHAKAAIETLERDLEAGAADDALAIAAGGSPAGERKKMHADLAGARQQVEVLTRRLSGVGKALDRKEREHGEFVEGHSA